MKFLHIIVDNSKANVTGTDSTVEPIEKKVKLTESLNKMENCKQTVDNNLPNTKMNDNELHFPGPSKQILPENASFGTSSIFTEDNRKQTPENDIEAPVLNKVSNEFANFKVFPFFIILCRQPKNKINEIFIFMYSLKYFLVSNVPLVNIFSPILKDLY